MELLRSIGPLLLAVVAALWVDREMERRGALAPRFRDEVAPDARVRRALALVVVAAILWAGAFAALGAIGEPPPDLSDLTIPRLFLLHGLLVVALAAWYVLGYLPPTPGAAAGQSPTPPPLVGEPRRGAGVLDAYGLRAVSPVRELAIGAAVGLAIWMLVLLVLLLLAGLVTLLGGREALPDQPPTVVLWIGGLPVWARIAVALSAGVVEETFFRGFLQPRVGIALSTILFALAHLGYGQPFMLVGVTLLSLFYAELARRRRSVWAPIAAHALFDLVQLLIVVPFVARGLERGDPLETLAILAERWLGLPFGT